MQYMPAIIFATLLILIALFLNKGKGLWLIAGFNTMPIERRKEYDIAAIGKFVSKFLIGMAICLFVFDFGWYINSIAIIVLSWSAFVFIVIFALVYPRGDRFRKK